MEDCESLCDHFDDLLQLSGPAQDNMSSDSLCGGETHSVLDGSLDCSSGCNCTECQITETQEGDDHRNDDEDDGDAVADIESVDYDDQIHSDTSDCGLTYSVDSQDHSDPPKRAAKMIRVANSNSQKMQSGIAKIMGCNTSSLKKVDRKVVASVQTKPEASDGFTETELPVVSDRSTQWYPDLIEAVTQTSIPSVQGK